MSAPSAALAVAKAARAELEKGKQARVGGVPESCMVTLEILRRTSYPGYPFTHFRSLSI